MNPYACLVPKKKRKKKKFSFVKVRRGAQSLGKADSRLLLLHFIPAPSGYLEWWMKLSGTRVVNQFNIHLFWKVHARDRFLSSCHDPAYLLLNTPRLALNIYLCFFGFWFFFLSGIQMVPCQQSECILRRVSAKTVRQKGKGVLHKVELLYFSAPHQNSKVVSECCKCSRKIQPY